MEDESLPQPGYQKLLKRTVQQLKQEIDRLSIQQQRDLKQATLTGLTPDEAKILEARGKQITTLIDQLLVLVNPESE